MKKENGCSITSRLISRKKLRRIFIYCPQMSTIPEEVAIITIINIFLLTLSWRRPLSYTNQSTDLLCILMDWFLYDNSLRYEIVKDKPNIWNPKLIFMLTDFFESAFSIYKYVKKSLMVIINFWRYFLPCLARSKSS